MFKQTLPFQSADFNYFDTTGDNLNTSNHTYWYKINNCRHRIQLLSTISTLQIIHLDTKPTFSLCIFQLFSTIWTLQIIHVQTNTTFSVGRVHNFLHKWRLFEHFKASCWYKINHFRHQNSTIFNNLSSSYHTWW